MKNYKQKWREVKDVLDLIYDKFPSDNTAIEALCEIEWTLRLAAYPEINEIKLTYQEMRELNSEQNLEF